MGGNKQHLYNKAIRALLKIRDCFNIGHHHHNRHHHHNYFGQFVNLYIPMILPLYCFVFIFSLFTRMISLLYGEECFTGN